MHWRDRLDEAGIALPSHRPGNHRTLCPQCSHTRRKAQQRCLSVTLTTTGAVWLCHHCGWHGGVGERTNRTRNRDMGSRTRRWADQLGEIGRKIRASKFW